MFGIWMYSSFRFFISPILGESQLQFDDILKIDNFLRLNIDSGKLSAPILFISSSYSSFSSSIQSGIKEIALFEATLSVEMFLKHLVSSGNTLNLFLDKLRKTSLVSLSKSGGNSDKRLLSASSLVRVTSFPKSRGSSYILLCLMLSDSR